jgi:hypothetical protein
MLDKFAIKMCWGSGGIDLQIRNPGITLRSGVNFKLCLVYSGTNSQCPFSTGPGTGVYEWHK